MVVVNREELALKFDVYKVVTESSPFSEFFAEYLSKDFRSDVYDFIEALNGGYNQSRAIFWEVDDGYSDAQRGRDPDHMFSSFKTKAALQEENRMRVAGVSVFDEERSKVIALAMKDHPEIVQAHIVFHCALHEYFESHLREVIEEDCDRLRQSLYRNEIRALRSKVDGEMPFDEVDKRRFQRDIAVDLEGFKKALSSIENGEMDPDSITCMSIASVLKVKADEKFEDHYKDFMEKFASISSFSGAASYFADLMPRVLDKALELGDEASVEEILLHGTDMGKNDFRSNQNGVLMVCPFWLGFRKEMDTQYGMDGKGNIVPEDGQSPNAAMLFVIERWRQLDAADPRPLPEIAVNL